MSSRETLSRIVEDCIYHKSIKKKIFADRRIEMNSAWYIMSLISPNDVDLNPQYERLFLQIKEGLKK